MLGQLFGRAVEGRVAAFHGDHLAGQGLHHRPLAGDADRIVVGALDVPARHRAVALLGQGERRGRDRDRLRAQALHGAIAVFRRDVLVEQRRQSGAREGVGEAVGADLARAAEQHVGIAGGHLAAGLARRRHQPADIDQRLDLAPPRLGGLADRDAAQRVADQHDRLFHLVEQARDLLDIVGQRDVGRRRVILAEAGQVGRADLVAVRFEQRLDLLPAPAAVARAMDQDERRHRPLSSGRRRCARLWRARRSRASAACRARRHTCRSR